jgi:hypothetical protein
MSGALLTPALPFAAPSSGVSLAPISGRGVHQVRIASRADNDRADRYHEAGYAGSGCIMSRWMQGVCIVLGSIAATVAVLAGALAWGPHHCKAAFPMVIGRALGSYESLAGGMIAASAALIAGWLAWNAV